jgi:hypothetical protein
MAFVSGLMGPYMSPIPINSSLGMAISLAIAFTVTPWLALKLMKPAHAAHGRCVHGRAHGPGRPLQRLFHRRADCPCWTERAQALAAGLGILAALALSVGLATGAVGGAEDAALRQQERVPGGGGHACRHAAGRHRRHLQEMGAFLAKQPEVRTCRAMPAPPAPSPSTAWCASTTCAPTPSRVTCRSTWSTSTTARQEPRHRAAPAPGAGEDRRQAPRRPRSRWWKCRPARR